MAPVSPGDHLPPALLLPQLGLQLQTAVLACSLERRMGNFGCSLSSCHAPRSVCWRSQAFSQCFAWLLLHKNKGHPIVELNCYTQKTVVDIPYVLINLCLSWAHQNGLDCECLHGAVWTSFLILCFPFIRIVGRNNTWSFSKQLILHVINKGSEKNTHCNHLPPLLLAVILVSELHTKIVILEEGGGMSELCLEIWQFFSRDAPMLSSLLSHFIWQSDSFPLECARV